MSEWLHIYSAFLFSSMGGGSSTNEVSINRGSGTGLGSRTNLPAAHPSALPQACPTIPQLPLQQQLQEQEQVLQPDPQ